MKKGMFLFSCIFLLAICSKARPPANYTNISRPIGTKVLKSQAGGYYLTYQYDGNLVLYKENGKPIRATNTNGKSSTTLSFQTDGNPVLYNYGRPVWGAQCHNEGGNWIILQDNGNLVIYTADNKPIWASNTGGL